MAASRFAAPHRAGRLQRRLAPRRATAIRSGGALFVLAAAAIMSGCVPGGPGSSVLVPNVAATSAETDAAKSALATGAKPSASDVKIAAREARQARESGTISGSAAIDRMIERHARENGLPPALAYAVVRVESRYNPRAIGGGAMGLSQIKPATARSLGFSGSSSALLDADTNLTYGMKYLKGAWEQGGHDVCRASMKYKGGHRTTRMTSAALRYCSAVKAHMAEVVRQRSRMAGVAPDPEEKGPIETLVAKVAPGTEPAPARRSAKATRTPTLAAFASRSDADAPASNGSLFPAARAGNAAPAAMTSEQAETVADAAASPSEVPVKSPRARSKNSSSRSRPVVAAQAAEPALAEDAVEARIDSAFD